MTDRPCWLCHLRPRRDGGNGLCPLRRDLPELDEAANDARHAALHPNGCSNFRVGDLRRRVKPRPMEALF